MIGIRAVLGCAMLSAAAVAQEAAPADVAERMREVIRTERILAPETSPPEAAQPRVQGDRVCHPTRDVALEVVVLREAEGGMRVVGLLAKDEGVFWTFAWRSGERPLRVVNGPYRLAAPVARDEVEAALRAHITPDGGAGYYEGMFADLARKGPGVVPHLLAIAREPGEVGAVRNLAVEALGECAGPADLAAVRALHTDSRIQGTVLQDSVVYSLARLGDRTLLDQQIQQLRAFLEQVARRGVEDPRSTRAWSALAHALLRAGQRDDAVKAYQDAITHDARGRAMHYYNLACAYALLGRTDDALGALEQSVREGNKDFAWMKRDGDLRSLREHPRFQALVSGRPKKEY